MESKEGLNMFRQVLLDCYGLWSWRLDGKLNVLESNSTDPDQISQVLLAKERARILKNCLYSETMPLILGNRMGLLWSVSIMPLDAGNEFFILGPIYPAGVSDSVTERFLTSAGVSFQKKRAFMESLSKVPQMSTIIFFQQTVMFHRYVTGDTVSVSDFVYHLPDERSADDPLTLAGTEMERPHSPLINEKILLEMVRTGNLEYHNALSAAGSASPGIRASIGSPIQQAKYSVVAFITLCSRAAIEGGLSSDIAYTLSDTYTENVDSCKTISEIAAVSHTMYEDYIRRVNRCRNADGVSHPMQASRDYIDAHLTEDISVDTLAARTGYTTYYFSRMFKKETGQTVKEYIRAARLRRAKLLLSSTHLSVQEISAQLCFCSQSYFALQFQKAEGITPAEYRAKYQNG